MSTKVGACYYCALCNSEASTVEYMKQDVDRTFKNGNPIIVPINQGAIYTTLSLSRGKLDIK